MSVYDIYSDEMGNFVRMLREQLKLTDGEQAALVLRSVLKAKQKKEAQKEEVKTDDYREFRLLCRGLVKMQCFSVILRFMNGVFKKWDHYDLLGIREVLSRIEVREGYTLDRLCQDYFLTVRDAMHRLDGDKELPEDVDLYSDQLDAYFDMNHDSGYHMCTVLPKVIGEKVYGMTLDTKIITEADVDTLVAKVRGAAGEAEPDVSAFEQDMGLPGALLPVFAACEVNGRKELCHCILEKYVLPCLAQVPWQQENRPEIPRLAVITGVYADYMQSLLVRQLPRLVDSDMHPQYLELVFRAEATGRGDPALFAYAGSHVTEYCSAHRELAVCWAATFHNGAALLGRILPEHMYSFHLSVIPYLLHFAGEEQQAAEFLLSHYNDLRQIDKRRPFVLTVLIRSILSATRPETANTLYGIYSYEMDRSRREKPRILELIKGMHQFMEEAKICVVQTGEWVRETGVLWEELLFGDGVIDGLLQRVQAAFLTGDVPQWEDYRTLIRCVEAFSHYSGIHLGILRLPPQDGYDKLDYKLPRHLMLRGQGLLRQVEEGKLFYSSMMQEQTRRDIHVHLQSHIFKLQRQLISDSLSRVARMKQALSGKEDEEQTLAAIQRIADELNDMLLSSTLGRDDAGRKINDLLDTFVQTCLTPADDPDLLQKVPAIRDDIYNYLVTSEVVFRMLEGKNDPAMDFSAALISLTKALELVMNYIYSRMNVHNYTTLDAGLRKEVFDKNGNKKASLTMGPCITLLKDARYINVAPFFHTSTLVEQSTYSDPHYARWGGDTVLDIPKLAQFGSIPIHINGYRNGAVTEEVMHFTTDPVFNRRLLAKALEYIKDNYRNPAAHKDILGIDKVRSCHQLLVEGEYLLWILLSIIK